MKNGIVDLKEKVTVVGTGKSAHMPKAKEYEVHPLHADTLVNNGAATLKK